jgi:hypothetical protein
MTGYWRDEIESGHKTGPHRTSIKAIDEYEKTYLDPFGLNSYQTAGFKKKNGKVSATSTMLSAKNIENLESVDLPTIEDPTDPTSVPVVLNVTTDDYNKITKDGRSWNIDSILAVIKKYSSDTYEKIRNMEKNQVVQPENDASYDKLITAFVNAAEKNIKYTWKVGEKKTDTYQIYLDNRSSRIIISIYYGSKL